METTNTAGATKRNTWVACPSCGHKVARVRTCDMECKCKYCGCEFEAVIGLSRTLTVREGAGNYKENTEKEGKDIR